MFLHEANTYLVFCHKTSREIMFDNYAFLDILHDYDRPATYQWRKMKKFHLRCRFSLVRLELWLLCFKYSGRELNKSFLVPRAIGAGSFSTFKICQAFRFMQRRNLSCICHPVFFDEDVFKWHIKPSQNAFFHSNILDKRIVNNFRTRFGYGWHFMWKVL